MLLLTTVSPAFSLMPWLFRCTLAMKASGALVPGEMGMPAAGLKLQNAQGIPLESLCPLLLRLEGGSVQKLARS